MKTAPQQTPTGESAPWELSEGAAHYEKDHHLPASRLLKRILVIDDEVNFTQLIKMHLEGTGRFEVKVLTDTRNVIAEARGFQPDLVMLDIVMPGKDGGDVAAELHIDGYLRNIPIIFVTALIPPSEAGDGTHVVKRGDKTMLGKPVRAAVLIQALDDMLRHLD